MDKLDSYLDSLARAQEEEPDEAMRSFMDVLLILVATLLVCTPINMIGHVSLPSLDHSGAEETASNENVVNVEIDAEGRIYLNGSAASLEELKEYAGKENTWRIAGDRLAPLGEILDVYMMQETSGGTVRLTVFKKKEVSP